MVRNFQDCNSNPVLLFAYMLQSSPNENYMEILILSLVAGMVVVGGVWMATRDTKIVEKSSDFRPPD